jgi:hypothetical protein
VKSYLPHIILLGVFLAALFPVMYYYSRRHPNPRFRPGAGELTLLFVLAMAVGLPGIYFVGNLFRKDVNTKQFTGKPDEGSDLFKTTYQKDDDEDEKGRKRRSKDD